MSRAFVNEDRQDFEPPEQFGLPPADDPSYDVAAAMVLLEAARDGRLQAAESATGYRWGDQHLHDHVRRLLAKEEERPEEERDRRLMKMAKRFLRAGALLLATLAALAAPGVAVAQAPPARLDGTQEIDVASRNVDGSFRVQVCLPDGYDAGDGFFPAVYVLDGDRSFGMACDVARWLARSGEVEPAIVVGIGYGRGVDAWWRLRARDLTPTPDPSGTWGGFPEEGGARAFLDFLATELIPIVDQRYRTRPGDRTLVGLSFGGLFGAWALVTEPDLFQRYILVSPAVQWADRGVFRVEASYAQTHNQLRARVWGAVGADDDRRRILDPWRDFAAQLASRHYRGLELTTRQYDDLGHVSVFPAALTDGLRDVLGR